MKNYLLILTFSFLSFTTFGKTIYTLSKDDFVKQFDDSSSFVKDRTLVGRIYCHNEQGNKVWLSCGENSILIARLNDKNEKKLMLMSIKYRPCEIQAKEYKANEFWIANRKINKYQINEIASFTIEEKDQKYEKPYFDIDSLRVSCANKNDSIEKLYSVGNEYVLFLTLKNNLRKDTFLIMENACYHMKFKDNSETVFGVIQKITKDSIVISSTYNQNMADFYKREFKIYHFPINDISEIKLLRTGGYSFKTIKIEDVPFKVIERKKEIENRPIWYSFDAMFGEINFYRVWFTDGRQYQGITEKEGKPISYEW